MKIRDNKGSITIFVLVGLLFMTSFLIISFGSNVNKSKTAKEQFNIISGIYSKNDGDKNAYERAYTAIRKGTKQTMNDSSVNSSTLELTKTFEENLSNYRIYGNSVQDTSTYGTPSPTNPVEVQSVGNKIGENLFPIDINKFYSFHTAAKFEEDGWISFKLDNTGKTNWGYINFWPKRNDGIVDNKDYTFILETDEINGEVQITFSQNRTDSASQFNMNFGFNNNISSDSQYFKNVKADNAASGAYLSRTYLLVPPGSNVSGKIRISIVEGIVTAENFDGYNNFGKYKIPVQVSGKNLLDISSITEFYRSNGEVYPNTSYIQDNVLTNNVGAYGNGVFAKPNVKYLEAGTYTISADIMADKDSGNKGYALGVRHGAQNYVKYGTIKEYKQWERISYTFKLTQNTIIDGFIFQGGGEAGDYNKLNIKFKNIMLEKANEATQYEEYLGQDINIYLNQPLRKVGDYADYIDFEKGEVVRKIAKVNLSDLDWRTTADSSAKGQYWANIKNTIDIDIVFPEAQHIASNFLCTNFRVASYQEYSATDKIIYSANSTRLIYIKDSNYTDLTTFKSAIKGVLLVSLVTPEKETISLPELSTLEDYTNIEMLTEVPPSKIEAEYTGYTME